MKDVQFDENFRYKFDLLMDFAKDKFIPKEKTKLQTNINLAGVGVDKILFDVNPDYDANLREVIAISEINDWLKQKTDDKKDEIFNDENSLVLVEALKYTITTAQAANKSEKYINKLKKLLTLTEFIMSNKVRGEDNVEPK